MPTLVPLKLHDSRLTGPDADWNMALQSEFHSIYSKRIEG